MKRYIAFRILFLLFMLSVGIYYVWTEQIVFGALVWIMVILIHLSDKIDVIKKTIDSRD